MLIFVLKIPRCHNEEFWQKNCIGYIRQIRKHHDFRKFINPHPRTSKISSKFQCFYDRVIRPASRNLNPIFDTYFSRRIGWYQSPIFYTVPERLFQTRVFLSFATSLRNHMGPYGIPGYGSLGILGPDGVPGYGSTKYH